MDILCDQPEDLVDSIHDSVSFASLELPLCIDLFCKKYKLVFPKSCTETVLSVIKENSKEGNITPTLIKQVQGILLLSKKHPKLISNLSY